MENNKRSIEGHFLEYTFCIDERGLFIFFLLCFLEIARNPDSRILQNAQNVESKETEKKIIKIECYIYLARYPLVLLSLETHHIAKPICK